MIRELTEKIISGEDLSIHESYEAMKQIMNGDVDEIMIAAFLVANLDS